MNLPDYFSSLKLHCPRRFTGDKFHSMGLTGAGVGWRAPSSRPASAVDRQRKRTYEFSRTSLVTWGPRTGAAASPSPSGDESPRLLSRRRRESPTPVTFLFVPCAAPRGCAQMAGRGWFLNGSAWDGLPVPCRFGRSPAGVEAAKGSRGEPARAGVLWAADDPEKSRGGGLQKFPLRLYQ
jgi:hypothetical protein